tara:strand:+ start:1040 stop:1489 length:450 start_codon:yes stop_codon:yes gene_type:complete
MIRNYRFIIMAMALIGILSACAKAPIVVPADEYAYMTMDTVQKACPEPDQVHPVWVLGVPVMVVRHNSCMKINNLLIIMGVDEDKNTELSQAVIHAAYLSYLNWLNKTEAPVVWSGDVLKRETITHDTAGLAHLAYYQLKSVKPPQPTN